MAHPDLLGTRSIALFFSSWRTPGIGDGRWFFFLGAAYPFAVVAL